MHRFGRGLMPLTIANIKSYYRDRAALFWTIAFPVIFVILFGSIFSGGSTTFKVGWVDEDQSTASAQLRSGFAAVTLLQLTDATKDDALAKMQDGDLDAVIVVPAGLGAAMGQSSAAGDPFQLQLYTDPSKQTASSTVQQVVAQVVGAINQELSGKPPALAVQPQTLQTENLTSAAYFVPSILAMALMQLGVFSAIPLVALREKLVLKRLSATPLKRWTLVSSNVIVRLIIGAVQTALILGIGIVAMGVQVIGGPLAIAGVVVLGAMTFIALGYVIASFARTEEAANGITQIVQLPMMFLSGIFFPLELMPDWLRGAAVFLPLTYLGDALRQTMVGGTPFAPLGVDVLVLGAWLVGSMVVSARFFRWQ